MTIETPISMRSNTRIRRFINKTLIPQIMFWGIKDGETEEEINKYINKEIDKNIQEQIKISAKIGLITQADKNGTGRILLEDIHINGERFRDHSWTPLTKRMYFLEEGDKITCTAKISEYISPEAALKQGLKKLRNIKVVKPDHDQVGVTK